MVNGVDVLAGSRLRACLDNVEDGQLGADQVARAWQRLEGQVRKRDYADAALHGPPAKTSSRLTGELVMVPLGLLAGGIVTAQLGVWSGSFIRFLPAWALTVAVGVAMLRWKSIRLFTWAWLIGSQLFAVWVLGVVTVALFR